MDIKNPVSNLNERNEGPPVRRTTKREPSSQEMPSSDSRTSRAGRVIKAPTAYAPAPSATTTGKRSSRKKDATIVCVNCHRGHSPSNNMIVFCDGCNATWHQKCHDPVIDDRVVLEPDAEWHCRSCKPVRRSTPVQPTKVKKQKRVIHPRLKTQSSLEVPGKQFTEAKRRAYLSQLSHAELVELTMKISTQNPAVPMFPANMTKLPVSEFSSTQNNQSASNSQSRKRTGSASALEDPAERKNPSKRTRTTSAPSAPLNPTNAKDLASEKKGKRADSSINDVTSEYSTARKKTRLNSAPASSILSTFQPLSSEPPNGPESPDLQARLATWRAKNRYARQFDVSFERPSKTPSIHSENETPSVTDRESSAEASEPRDLSQPLEEPETETDSSSTDAFEPVVEHRIYPRPGNGFTTSTDPVDLDILQEQADYPTFSHSVHGPAKKLNHTKTPISPRRAYSIRK